MIVTTLSLCIIECLSCVVDTVPNASDIGAHKTWETL